MALVQVKEQYNRNSSIVILPQTNKQYVRTWQVVTDNPYDDAVAVENYWVNATGITAGSQFPSDVYAIAKDIRVNCTDVSGKFWTVTCNYGPSDNTDQEINPILKPAEYEWSFAQFTENTNYDIYGRAIINSAGDMFLGGVQRDNSRPVLKVKKNQYSFSPLLAAYYKDAINGTPFVGAPIKTVKCQNISTKNVFDSNFGWYWACDFEFQFDFRTWDAIMIDQGLREYDPSKRERVPILDGGSEKCSEPEMLNGYGKKLTKGGTPIYIRYTIYNILPFTVFVF